MVLCRKLEHQPRLTNAKTVVLYLFQACYGLWTNSEKLVLRTRTNSAKNLKKAPDEYAESIRNETQSKDQFVSGFGPFRFGRFSWSFLCVR